MTGVAPMACERCGELLEATYSTTAFSASAQTLQVAPDGRGAQFDRGGFVACSWNCLAVLAAQRAGAAGDAAVRIVAERERQVTAEGWTPEHDASHSGGELALAGVLYALHAMTRRSPGSEPLEIQSLTEPDKPRLWTWPWDPEWWKPKDRDRDLIRAGALIAAELDRGGSS